MMRLISLVKAVCEKLYTGFLKGRLLSELPGADELIQRHLDHHSDDPRGPGGLPMVGVF